MDILVSGKKKLLAAFIAVLCCILMVVLPQAALDSARKAINLWMTDVLPALLPFFICAGFLQNIGVMAYFKSGTFPFVMSMLSGYPMGAGIIGGLKRSGSISGEDAKRMLSYCSTSGLAFVIGAVGAGMLGSGSMGMVIAAAHYIGALMNGMIYSRIFYLKSIVQSKSIMDFDGINHAVSGRCSVQEALTESILMSLRSMGIILAYIVIFMFVTDVLTIGGVFDLIERPWLESLIKGFIEMTVGCESVAVSIAVTDDVKCILCSFMISWGGLSIIGQTMSMLSGTGISLGYVLVTKLTHGLFSAAVAFAITAFMV